MPKRKVDESPEEQADQAPTGPEHQSIEDAAKAGVPVTRQGTMHPEAPQTVKELYKLLVDRGIL